MSVHPLVIGQPAVARSAPGVAIPTTKRCSCRLTSSRPEATSHEATDAWAAVEAAKRRLVHQLDELALPIEVRSTTSPGGLAFSVVAPEDSVGAPDIIDSAATLKPITTDDSATPGDRCRDGLRHRCGEPVRSVVEQLRHEVGHRYWGRLVAQTNHLDGFRRLFGDERANGCEAVERGDETANAAWDRSRFATASAASHPFEDWAETFAHYLHLLDVTETATVHGLVAPRHMPVHTIVETLGAPAGASLESGGGVVDKLAFVHQQISAHMERHRFYAST